MEKIVLEAESFKPVLGKGPHGGGRYIFRKNVNGKKYAVVAELNADKCWIVTGYEE